VRCNKIVYVCVNIHEVDAVYNAVLFVILVGDVCSLAGSELRPILYFLCLTHTPALKRQVVVFSLLNQFGYGLRRRL
jgi:hypothetical protein